MEAASASEQIGRSFTEATNFMPELSIAGRFVFIADAIRMIRDETASWSGLVNMSLEGTDAKGKVLRSAKAAHDRFNVPSIKDMGKRTDFTLELVRSGANHAIAVLAGGDNTVETVDIKPLNPGETAIAEDFLRDEANRSLVLEIVTAMSIRMGEDDILSALGDENSGYKKEMAEISQQYPNAKQPGDPGFEAKEEAKNIQRGELMGVIVPRVMGALAPYLDRPGVRAFVNALLCGKPSDELFQKYETKPQG